jgi:DNA-binding transcriptional regulator YiaG
MSPHELIRAQRALCLSCEELAETLGVSWDSARQWRSGRRSIPDHAARRITDLVAMPETEREAVIFRRKVKWRRAA